MLRLDIKTFKKFILLFLFPFALYSSIIIAVCQFKESKIQNAQEHLMADQMRAFNAIYDKYKGMSEIVYNVNLNKKDLLEIIASDENIATKKEKLFDILQEKYTILKQFNFEQIQFHTKENISIVRMENPDKFGDDLSLIRPSIAHANKFKEAFETFEIGAHVYGYRFVYPLFYNKNYLGSVEMDISTNSFLNTLQKLYKNDISFLLNKKTVNKVLVPNHKLSLKESGLENFYLANSTSQKDLQKLLTNDMDILQKRILNGVPFTYLVNNHILTFLPIENKITSNIDGVYLFDQESKQIESINSSFRVVFVSITFVFLLLYFMFYKLNNFRLSLIQKTNNMRNILDNQDAIVVVTNGFQIEDANKKLFEFFGYKDMKEFVSKHECICENFIYEEGKDYILSRVDGMVWSEYIMQNGSKNHLVKMRSVDNTEHIFQASISTFDDKYILNFNDITKQKQLETALEILNKDLEIKIASEIQENQKKDQVIQQQLRLAQMGEMISMIAHQWRQPLASISSSIVTLKLQIVLQKYDLTKEEGREEFLKNLNVELNDVEEFVQHLTHTIDNFRSFYKSNDTLEEFFAREILQKVIGSIKLQFGTNQIEIIEEYQATKKVMVYAGDLFKVFFNIFLNCVENFIEKNIEKRKIYITTSDIINGVLIKICDTGGGIPNSIIDRIFDPYFSTKNKKNETGLGLYSSKIIIEKYHNGAIYADNTDDGVCFYIEIKNG